MKTLVVLSGGMDSTTLLYKAQKESEQVVAVSFRYGQRHHKELDAAVATCKKLNIKHKVVDISAINELILGSALTDDIEVPEGHYEGENMKLTVVPNRNSIFANLAIAYAVSLKFDTVALGVHAGDHAIYPDCRPVWVKALAVLAEVANYEPINIYTPYLHKTKIDIIKEGAELGVDYSLTWTCYKGLEKSCGKCGSCCERVLSFFENGIKDPIEYEEGWEVALNYAKQLVKND